MRLTREQTRFIVESIHRQLGSQARVLVYGSRLDDKARGGDLDLLIESDELPPLLMRADLKLELETGLSMPVDVLTMKRGAAPTAFQRIARANAVPLLETHGGH